MRYPYFRKLPYQENGSPRTRAWRSCRSPSIAERRAAPCSFKTRMQVLRLELLGVAKILNFEALRVP